MDLTAKTFAFGQHFLSYNGPSDTACIVADVQMPGLVFRRTTASRQKRPVKNSVRGKPGCSAVINNSLAIERRGGRSLSGNCRFWFDPWESRDEFSSLIEWCSDGRLVPQIDARYPIGFVMLSRGSRRVRNSEKIAIDI
jgi:hypothetical protein